MSSSKFCMKLFSSAQDTKVELMDDRSIVLTAPASSNTFKNSVRGITKLSHK